MSSYRDSQRHLAIFAGRDPPYTTIGQEEHFQHVHWVAKLSIWNHWLVYALRFKASCPLLKLGACSFE